MLHVMVPDKVSPTFDGHVLLDYRTVHLIECVDGKSDALFNKIVRDSIIKVRWELEWFEEEQQEESHSNHHHTEGAKGKWVNSNARYYIRIANQILVEDDEMGVDAKGFVMITADVNVRLHHCSKGKGQEDFNRLVNEGQVQSTPSGKEEAQQPIMGNMTDSLISDVMRPSGNSSSSSRRNGADDHGMHVDAASLHKVLDMSKDLKECMAELLEERERTVADRRKMARAFVAFTTEGNLDAGYTLATQMEGIIDKEESAKQKKYRDETDLANATAEEAWHLITRLEKTLHKMQASSATVGGRKKS